MFAEQAARAGARPGVDWIVVESMTDVEEMAIAVRAAVETTRLPVVASMTYNRTPEGLPHDDGQPARGLREARRGSRRVAHRRQLRLGDRGLRARSPRSCAG